MGLSSTIAWRYLFSKKSHSAINIISMVSVCGVALTTMALICTLSVYNGFQELIASLYSTLDPDIKIEPIKGKTFDISDTLFTDISKWENIEVWSPVLEENVLLVYRDKQMPALMKGVSDNFGQLTEIDKILLDGNFMLRDSIVGYATIGVGIANQLEAGALYIHYNFILLSEMFESIWSTLQRRLMREIFLLQRFSVSISRSMMTRWLLSLLILLGKFWIIQPRSQQ